MPISVTSFSNGTVMSAPTMRANLAAIQTYLNGGVVITDIDNASIKTRHFRKPDSYGAPNRRTVGVTGTIWHRYIDGQLINRCYHTHQMGGTQSTGNSRFHDVWGNSVPIFVPEQSTIEIACSYWAWHVAPNNGQVNAEQYEGGDVALSLDNTVLDETRRTIFDSGTATTIAAGGNGAGPLLYAARQVSVFTMQTVAAGEHDIALAANIADHSANPEYYGRLIIGARMTVVDYYRR